MRRELDRTQQHQRDPGQPGADTLRVQPELKDKTREHKLGQILEEMTFSFMIAFI